MTRASAAYAYLVQDDRVTRSMFLCGDDFPRHVWRRDASGLWICGTLIEPLKQSNILQSRDFSAAAWSTSEIQSVSTDAYEAPDGEQVVDGIVATTVNTTHILFQARTLTAARWCWRALARPGRQSWMRLYDTTLTNVWGSFNISSQVLGSAGDGIVDYGIEPNWHQNLCLCWISFTGTAASHSMRIYIAESDTDIYFAGDGVNPDIYLVDAQLEEGDFPSSTIVTAGSPVTRSADSAICYTNPLPDARQGWLAAKVLIPDHTPSADVPMITLSDDGAAADRIRLLWEATTGNLKTDSASTGGSAGSATAGAVADGKVHDVFCSWKPGRLFCAVDGKVGAPDTDVDISAGLNRLELDPCGAVIANLQMGDKFRRVPYRPQPVYGG